MAVAKQRGTWTYGDLFRLPDDDKRYEIIDGELYELPASTPVHQTILMQLIRLLLSEVDRLCAKLLPGPIDVFMPGADPVDPDLLVLMPERRHLESCRGIEGAPDLVVEILSPSNPRHDRVRKRVIYARGGVREYWLVSPESESIEVLVLDGDEFRTHVYARGDDVVRSMVLTGLSFSASTVFEPSAGPHTA